jgi:hypothetical protein
MKRYLAFDVGCIECGEPSTVIGVFKTKAAARAAAGKAGAVQHDNWSGQHSFEVHEIEVPE